MNIQHRQFPHMTLDEFFAWDGGGHVGKLELVEGVVRAMSPASAVHSIIQTNIAFAIRAHLLGSKSRIHAAVEGPLIPPLGRRVNARAPDVVVAAGLAPDAPVFQDPVLIVEVMSPSNEEDTWESIHALAGLASLKEIMVVQSESVSVEIYTRDAAGAWPRDPVTAGAGGTIHLASLALDLPVAEVYAGTHLIAST